jgi:hypothetical protein
LSTWHASEAVDAVLLSWSFSERPTEIKRHRATLEGLTRGGKCAWIRLTSSFTETRFRLTSVEHTFPASVRNETIRRELIQWHSFQNICLDRIYLVAQEHVKETCYDITDYIKRCLTGDLSIADRLRGRTIFGLRQIETDAYDLLSSLGSSGVIKHALRPYIHEFGDFIGNTILGFCCQLPSFLSPLNTPALTVPWSPDLRPYFQSIWGERLTEHLPLIFYGAHGTAAIRSAFWDGLTQQYSKVWIDGFRKFCHRLRVQYAVEIPASEQSLEFDIGTILKYSDGAIFIGPKENANSSNSQDAKEKSRTASHERLCVSDSTPFPIDTPKRFLIVKCIASQAGTRTSRIVSIWRSKPPTTAQYAFDRALGFNSWMANESENTDEKDSKCEEKHASRDFVSQSFPLKQARNLVTRSACSIGVPQRSVLIISPLQSLWSRTDEREWREITSSWAWLCQTVWNLGYDFDIATESDCVNAKFNKSSRSIRVNTGSYRVVLIPSCTSLQEYTVSLLTGVIAGRGKLIAVDPVPYLFNSKLELDTHPLELLLYHQRASLLRGTVAEKTETLKQLLRKWVKPVLRVYAKPDNILTSAIRFQHRRTEAFDLFYLFNATQSSVETLIEIRGESEEVEEWGATSGEKSDIDFWHADGNTYLNRSFDCWQSRLVTTRRKVRQPLS